MAFGLAWKNSRQFDPISSLPRRIRDSERMLARWIGVLTGSWFALLFLFYALAT